MDAFLGLYDNGTDSESEDCWIATDTAGAGLPDPVETEPGQQPVMHSLPPEPQSGNVEYKLKLVNPTEQRIQHLVTQV